MIIKKHIVALVGVVSTFTALSSRAADPYAPIQPFLERYCVECHGEKKQKGEVRLDDFGAIDGQLWVDVFDQIHHGDMPPEDEPQPSEKELADFTKLVDQISRDDTFSTATGYRRLNRREYANTVRDLLGLKSGLYNPAARIYQDEVDHGFDTNAKELIISNQLLLEYLDSAENSLRAALFLDKLKRPVTETKNFASGRLDGGNRRYTTHKIEEQSTVIRGRGPHFAREAMRRVAVAGNYRVTITAAGVDRDYYGKVKFPPVTGQPVNMGIGARLDSRKGAAGGSNLVESFDLKDEEFQTFQVEMWLEKGAYPWVSFQNGSVKPAVGIRAAVRSGLIKYSEIPKNYRGPGVEVSQFRVEGPLDPEWPPATYKTTFQVNEMPDFKNAKVRDALIMRFVTRAFRRPATEIDLQDYRAYLDKQYQKTGNWHEAYIKTFAAVMAAHDFLYIKEEVGELPPYELANRLSYFLWSTMPDAELFKLAQSGKILDDKVYSAQLKRLLHDPRSQEFVRAFATQWLSLDLLGTMAPATRGPYAGYYKGEYEAALRNETLQYFRHVLFENQPVGDFLDSDYTFLNKTLAQVYKLPFEGGADFQRVSLPKNSVRGGLLGHGSILSLTSNGVETLPVTRGHWVLDELLGTPPPPAPAEVPALVPDLTGVDTPRAHLVRHREDPACYECHKQMDPIGLALENFDVIGRYRGTYQRRGPKIDSAGEMYGVKFKNVVELRKILRSREGEFAENLTIKIAEYAKGRKLNRGDLEIVDQVVAKAKTNEYRFKSLLAGLIMSKLMRDR